jgi:hypothetical protein
VCCSPRCVALVDPLKVVVEATQGNGRGREGHWSGVMREKGGALGRGRVIGRLGD